MATGKQLTASEKRPRRYLRAVLIIAGLIVVAFGEIRVWWKSEFPYGQSHSCAANLGLALRMFSGDHNDWLPYGGKTPEESLSIICSNGDPYMLKFLMRGKHLPQSVVDNAFARDGVLSPESCGWHYVEGLREGDDPNLAIAWDKTIGLDHNGRRRDGLMHEVILITGSHPYISVSDWPQFVKKQKQLLMETAAQRPINSPSIRWSDEAALGPSSTKPRNVPNLK